MRIIKTNTPVRKIRKDTRLQRHKEQTSILTAQIEALSSHVQALQVKNCSLQLRGEVVLSSVIAAHFAVKMMKQNIFQDSSNGIASLSAVTALEQVEARLRVLVPHQSPQLLLEPLAQWLPSNVSADISETLLKRYLKRSLVGGISHQSLLDGGLCSFLHATFILMLYDTTIQERTVQLVNAGPDAWKQWIADTRHDIEQLMASLVEPDGSKSSSALSAIAALLLHFHSMWCVGPLLHPQFLASTIGYHPEMGLAKPLATAQLDMVVEDLALSEEQLTKTYEIGQIYQALAAPLESQKAAIKARMAKLLAAGLGSQFPGGPQPAEPAASSWPAAAAAAASLAPAAATAAAAASSGPAAAIAAAAAASLGPAAATAAAAASSWPAAASLGPAAATSAAGSSRPAATAAAEEWPAAAATAARAGSTSPPTVAARTPSAWWSEGPAAVEQAAAGSSYQDTTDSSSAGDSSAGGFSSGSSLQVHIRAAMAAAATAVAAVAAARVEPTSSAPKAESPLAPTKEPLLPANDYYELLELANQLPGIEGQLFFMDLCCSHVMAGVLSWGQLAHYFVASHPYQPHIMFMGRLLYKRAAQHVKCAR